MTTSPNRATTATRVFTVDELTALGLPDQLVEQEDADDFPDIAIELHRELVEVRRGHSVNDLVFRAPDDGRTWRVQYQEGLSEFQDDHNPWSDEKSVTAVEVKPYEVTTTAWLTPEQQASHPTARPPAQPAPLPITGLPARLPTPDPELPWPYDHDNPVRAVHLAAERECRYINPADCPIEEFTGSLLAAYSYWLAHHQTPTGTTPAPAYTTDGVTVRPTRYEVSTLDPEHVNYNAHKLIVEISDRYGWGVNDGHRSLDAHYQWADGHSIFGRDAAWTARYRHDHDTALAIAIAVAPHHIVNRRYPDGSPAPLPGGEA